MGQKWDAAFSGCVLGFCDVVVGKNALALGTAVGQAEMVSPGAAAGVPYHRSMREQFPSDPGELGARMRALRGRTSLNLLARDSEYRLSKSTLSRYENGQLPRLEHAALLSKLYGGNGWLELAIKNLWRGNWDPWAEEFPEMKHAVSWSGEYSGEVWIKVMPQHYRVGVLTTICLAWGPWRYSHEQKLGADGITFQTSKSKDLHDPVDLRITTSEQVFVLNGTGDVDDAIDIHDHWTHRHEPEVGSP